MNNINEGVGKRIVDALKEQSSIEVNNITNPVEPEIQFADNSFEEDNNFEFSSNDNAYFEPQAAPMNFSVLEKESFANDLEGFEIPTNVAVLKQLINQLPAGVSRQTGAQIIKQTMEALGISMKGVLQEAQQVQENLNSSSRECQASIMEHKKQIGILEKQSQRYQKQYAALNEIISLFVQTNI